MRWRWWVFVFVFIGIVGASVGASVCPVDADWTEYVASARPCTLKRPTTRSSLFVGDSTTKALFNAYRVRMRCATKRTQADRCDVWRFIGARAPDHWTPPDRRVEGPYNPHHPGCPMCNSCVGEEWHDCARNESVTFVPLEYARDVTYQTNADPTSQAALLRFVTTRRFDRLIFNAGMHDQGLIGTGLTDAAYVANVRAFVAAARPLVPSLVWVSTNWVRGDAGRPQSNRTIARWNAQVRALLDAHWPDVARLEAERLSTSAEHHDNVHMAGPFYAALATML